MPFSPLSVNTIAFLCALEILRWVLKGSSCSFLSKNEKNREIQGRDKSEQLVRP